MQELTIENAKNFAIEQFNKLPESKARFFLLHTEAVIEVLKMLGEFFRKIFGNIGN